MKGLLIVLIGLALVLAVTNPSMDDFRLFIRNEVRRDLAQDSRFGWMLGAAGLVRDVTGWDAVDWLTDRMLRDTHRQDYVVASVYTVWFSPDKPTRIIGLFNRFFVLAD